MSEFVYYAPTKVIFGANAELTVGCELKNIGATKVLIHYGSERIVKSGLLALVQQALIAENINFVLLGGVVPNPRLSKIEEGIALVKSQNIDCILAIGGGSVIDSAKGIALGACHDGPCWDFFDGKAKPQQSLPITTILTIAAAGSEMSSSLVITNEDGNLKRGIRTDLCRCRFALINPELMSSLPQKQIVNGIVDILMHTLERYFHAQPDLEINDRLAEGLMLAVLNSAQILQKDSQNKAALESLIWAGSLSHNELTGCGSNGGDWATHQIEHEISGLFDVDHGAGLSVVWPSWARYVLPAIPHRFAKFAERVMGISPSGNPEQDGLAGIKALEDFFVAINSPIKLNQLLEQPVTDEQIEEMAIKCTHFGKRSIGQARRLEQADIAAILKMANQ